MWQEVWNHVLYFEELLSMHFISLLFLFFTITNLSVGSLQQTCNATLFSNIESGYFDNHCMLKLVLKNRYTQCYVRSGKHTSTTHLGWSSSKATFVKPIFLCSLSIHGTKHPLRGCYWRIGCWHFGPMYTDGDSRSLVPLVEDHAWQLHTVIIPQVLQSLMIGRIEWIE